MRFPLENLEFPQEEIITNEDFDVQEYSKKHLDMWHNIIKLVHYKSHKGISRLEAFH